MEDSEEAMRAFMAEGGFTFPVMLAPGEVARGYGIHAIPAVVLVDRQGKLVRTSVGGTDAAEISSFVDELLR